jgi:hypothetical protein
MQELGMMAWRMMTTGAVAYVQGRLKEGSVFAPKPRETGETAIPHEGEHAGGCPICAIHRQVSEGYLLLRGLTETYRTEGRIPQGIGGTIPLARNNFEAAQAGLTKIAAADPDLRLQALTVQGRLSGIIMSLSGNVSPESLPGIADEAERAWHDTYQLADRAFRHETASAELPLEQDPLFIWIQRARSEGWDADRAMSELQAVIKGPAARVEA